MLKKAMASKPAKVASASSRKQATGTSGLSLEELDDIHRKRQELSRALKAGNLSREKIEEINSRKRKSEESKSSKSTSRSRGEKGDSSRSERKERKRRKSPRPAMRMRADDYEKRERDEKTRLKSTVVSKAHAVEAEYGEEQDDEIENAEPALEKSDLRHQLAERRKRLEELRTSGLKVQVANENYQTAPAAAGEKEERPSVSPPPVTE